jgi:hypothetical protein
MAKRKKWACMETEKRKSKDVDVFVTGVSMGGETNLDEHHGTTGEDQGGSSTEEVTDSREDDIRENI